MGIYLSCLSPRSTSTHVEVNRPSAGAPSAVPEVPSNQHVQNAGVVRRSESLQRQQLIARFSGSVARQELDSSALNQMQPAITSPGQTDCHFLDPIAGYRSDAQQLEIIERYRGLPCLGSLDKENIVVATIHTQPVLAINPNGTFKNVDSATFDSLCLAEEIHLIVKSAFTFGTGNRKIFLDKTGGENWVRVHMARATIDKAFSSGVVPADEAMVAVAHEVGSCWEHAMLSFSLASNSGVDLPVFAVYDEKDDHTYVLIGDPWKESEDKVVVVDPSMLTPIAHNLADSTLHFPCRDGVEIIAKHDPKNPQKTKSFSMDAAWQQKKITQQDIAEYISARNNERQALWMQPLPKRFGPEFIDVLADNGENTDWIFDCRFSIADPNIVYTDGHGRERTFNTLPLGYLERYFQLHTVEDLTHSGKGYPVTR